MYIKRMRLIFWNSKVFIYKELRVKWSVSSYFMTKNIKNYVIINAKVDIVTRKLNVLNQIKNVKVDN